MKNPFVTDGWDSKRRAVIPVLSRLGLVSVLAFSVLCMAAITQVDLTTQVKGLLPIANGGTNTSSTLTGIVRGGASYTASEFSGDCTTSGSNVVTCQKDNGTTVPTNSAADQVLLTTASATGAWASIPNCTGALAYSTTTHLFSCNSVLTGNFADNEVPTGTVNGVNAAFTLAHTPSPAASLSCSKNGQLMIAGGADYTLATATLTYVAGAIPKTGDAQVCNYRW
jgi:predicted porin